MATLENSCSACYKATAPECLESYLLGGFTYGVGYTVISTDSRGRKWQIDNELLADSDGNITLVFPEGLNTTAAGTLTLQVFLNSDIAADKNFCIPLPLNLCDETYTCIELSFYRSDLSMETFQILCLCDEELTCDGMCEDESEEFGFVGITTVTGGVPEGNGSYLHTDSKVILTWENDILINATACCAGIAAYYPDMNTGPFQFNGTTWVPMIVTYLDTWGTGELITIHGEMPEFSTAVCQISLDSGTSYFNAGNSFTYEQFSSGVTIPVTQLSFRWRILVTLANGCSYPSAQNTLFE